MLSLALVALLLAAPKIGDPAPAVSVNDVKGRAVTVPEAGKPMVLALVSKATGEKAAEVTKEVRLAHPEATVITFIDLSGYPGFLQVMVKSKVKARHEEAVKDNADAWKKAGKVPPADLDARIHLVTDFDGKIVAKAYGATNSGKEAAFVVVAADGTVAAVFEKTPTGADVNGALDKLTKK